VRQGSASGDSAHEQLVRSLGPAARHLAVPSWAVAPARDGSSPVLEVQPRETVPGTEGPAESAAVLGVAAAERCSAEGSSAEGSMVERSAEGGGGVGRKSAEGGSAERLQRVSLMAAAAASGGVGAEVRRMGDAGAAGESERDSTIAAFCEQFSSGLLAEGALLEELQAETVACFPQAAHMTSGE